jgi:hypothetical protein
MNAERWQAIGETDYTKRYVRYRNVRLKRR